VGGVAGGGGRWVVDGWVLGGDGWLLVCCLNFW
jgi:hypothetical protein